MVDQGYSCAEFTRRLGLSDNDVNRWARQQWQRNGIEFADGFSREEMEAEFKRYRKENKRLEMERDILNRLVLI